MVLVATVTMKTAKVKVMGLSLCDAPETDRSGGAAQGVAGAFCGVFPLAIRYAKPYLTEILEADPIAGIRGGWPVLILVFSGRLGAARLGKAR
jgi:hypothetical protein